MPRRLAHLLVALLLVSAPLGAREALASQPPTAQPAQVDGFVPIDQLPPREQLPAAPFLITAYVFVWVLLMAYIWTIARRLSRVERDLQSLERRSSRHMSS